MTRAEATEVHRCSRFRSAGRGLPEDGRAENCPGASSSPGRGGLLPARAALFLRRLDVPGSCGRWRWRARRAAALLLEDAGPEDLERRLARGPLALDAFFFDVAIALAETCARIHGSGVVHRAIAPSRVVLGEEGGHLLVHFLDAGRADEHAPSRGASRSSTRSPSCPRAAQAHPLVHRRALGPVRAGSDSTPCSSARRPSRTSIRSRSCTPT